MRCMKHFLSAVCADNTSIPETFAPKMLVPILSNEEKLA